MADEKDTIDLQGAYCPIPLRQDETIVIGHGSGGKMMHDLIRNVFASAFDNPILAAGNDAGLVALQANGRLAVSTDAHVVKPIIFPGGDIGRLAVCGTVNDVAMLGAAPRYLTAGFILEEGLSVATLSQIVTSMQNAASEAGVQIIAGDTKVVERGKADQIYITTAGFGEIIPYPALIGGAQARPGDRVIISGTLGDHGIAVLGARGELGFEADVSSDVAPLNKMIQHLLEISDQIHVLRDPTRGGLATSLNEIAAQSQVGIVLDEASIPVHPAVQSACEMLGLDPLYIANEGKLIVICTPEDEELVLAAMREFEIASQARTIGQITDQHPGRVIMRNRIGSHRVVDVLSGELLPRIC